MNGKCYNAPWGRQVSLVTMAIFAGAILVVVGSLFLPVQERADRAAKSILPLSFAAVFLIGSLFRIRAYEVTTAELRIVRGAWRNRIPLAGLSSVERDREAMKGARKQMGNDGLFAIHGTFSSARLGVFKAFITDPANSVVLRGPGRTVVVSPENPSSFVDEITVRIRDLEKRR